MKRWYAVYTRPRQEALAEEHLARQGFEVYLPWCRTKRRRRGAWADVVEPLFPRYLFLRADLAEQNTAAVRSTRGVVGFVRFGGLPADVPDAFIDQLRARADQETGVHTIAPAEFVKGEAVEVVDGPLAGVEAVFFARDGAERVVLLYKLFGRDNKVVVPRNQVVSAA